ncbi:Rrf2 family transcriptional regulator [Seongchinamella unica]|uniref:Rrf2 family transcriptional regulator n=1 Tax=Seongchinamella unica TaxID=2547392 RepID=A0A4R5LPY6_9GAMM|nr:Rrf2 family transcriptional regulator [Seongchinamella unica]TDG12622.1 Rrf2 family transcriptional regulator [Seongchinamella unica]
MRLTTFTDYSIRVLAFVATKDEGKSTIQEIAHRYGISRNHLMKVVQELHQKGYLVATRGKNGGLSLSRPPEEINLGALVRDVEKDFNLAECLGANNSCVITPVCGLRPVLASALDAFFNVLDQHTLADIFRGTDKASLAQLLRIS